MKVMSQFYLAGLMMLELKWYVYELVHLFTIDVKSLTAPHLPKATFSQDVEYLEVVPRELPPVIGLCVSKSRCLLLKHFSQAHE
jgi:hypothetical protein